MRIQSGGGIPGGVPQILRRDRGVSGSHLWCYDGGTVARGAVVGGTTYHRVGLAEAPFNGMQLIFFNYNTAATYAVGGAAACAATTISSGAEQINTTVSSGTNPESYWQVATVAGAAPSWTVPAASTVAATIGGMTQSGAVTGITPGIIITDVMRLRSLAPANTTNNPNSNHIFMFRTLRTAAELNYQYFTTGSEYGLQPGNFNTDVATNLNLPSRWGALYQEAGADRVNSGQASFAGTTMAGGEFQMAVLPVFHYDYKALNVIAPGDSIVRGTGTTGLTNDDKSYMSNGCYQASTPTAPVNVVNLGYPSMMTPQFGQFLRAYVTRANVLNAATPGIFPVPDICFIPTASPNDLGSSTTGGWNIGWFHCLDLCQFCIDNKITPVLLTPFPQAGGNPTIDGQITTISNRVKASGFLYADILAATRDPATLGWIAGYNTDAVHPSNTGAAAAALVIKAKLQSIISTNQ